MKSNFKNGRTNVSAASLGLFRIALGLTLTTSAVRLFAYGWVDTLYVEPEVRFTYLGFGWVPRLSAPWIHVLVAVVGVSGAWLTTGWRARWASGVAFLAFTWLELQDKALYLNHYYLVSLLLLWGVFLPLDARYSVRAVRTGPRGVDAVSLSFYRFQIAVVYVFAGIAKVRRDWLMEAEPLRTWLLARTDTPLVGPMFAQEWFAYAMSWGGAAFDLLVIPALLWWRTRAVAMTAVIGFHVVTWALFPIGVFPWLMIAGASLWLEPDWPERLLRRVGTVSAMAASPLEARRLNRPLRTLMMLHIGLQVLLPIRHHFWTDDVLWTEVGYRFSWHVMLVEKSGDTRFRVVQDGSERVVLPSTFLTPLQLRMMATQPDMIVEGAALIERRTCAALPRCDIEVFADSWVSMHGAPAVRLIVPSVDITTVPRAPWYTAHILPR